jgi:UDP-N-acetylglucosamine--N-acetylmuramyl-(pentapeptide) pyrophosphoryl-undecaprenol N-acetylglucosamine transferase
MAVNVVLAGGGTGGHVFPALALAEAIVKAEPAANVRFLGTASGLEGRLVPQAGYPLDAVPARPIVGRGWRAALAGLGAVGLGTLRARRVLKRTEANLVIGVGGYASVPAVAAAATMGIPAGLLEPNARPGRANRILGRVARAVFLQFDEAAWAFPARKVHRVGTPVRAIPVRKEPVPVDGPVRLLILGGSQGARSINRAISASLDRLGGSEDFQIVHQTGDHDLETVRQAYLAAEVMAEVVPFLEDVPEQLSRCDLIVARAGAATVAELCAAGLPSILVPYPFAADDHQMANARALERLGACVVVPDDVATEELAPAIRELARDAERRRRMADAARQRATPDAACDIWRICSAWIAEDPGGPG